MTRIGDNHAEDVFGPVGMRTCKERRFSGILDSLQILEGPNGRFAAICRGHVTSTQPIIFRGMTAAARLQFVTYTLG